ncbi:IclR family transcriptional regulator [Halosimplex salinum]|uniref:IclR family transcriptional regulator n=1 Tax=Halosimplex salinum TaxID=1710538 RepID=UPI000F47DED7|nr:IclR family transcriptional regulator [Halosimplex salinum]
MDITRQDDSDKQVKSVRRAFDVVGVVRAEGTVRIADVASALDIPTSTAHVHLKTLEAAGYVVQDADGYRLSYRFLRDGVTVRDRENVYNATKSEVEALAEETGEVANLGVEENGQRVILYQAEGTEAVHDNAPIGEYTEMHWTALGKAMLAHLPVGYVDQIVDTYGLPRARPNTITDRDRLDEELATIRDRNYAVEDEERREGIRSLASPIVVDDTVVGAVSVTGPKERFDDDRIQQELLPELRNTVNVVEVKYAYD